MPGQVKLALRTFTVKVNKGLRMQTVLKAVFVVVQIVCRFWVTVAHTVLSYNARAGTEHEANSQYEVILVAVCMHCHVISLAYALGSCN